MYTRIVNLLSLAAVVIQLTSCNGKNPSNGGGKNQLDIVWEQTSLDSLDVLALVATEQNDIFAAACGHPIFRSFDQGISWTSTMQQACPKALVATNQEGVYAVGGGIGILFSDDRGQSWSRKSVRGFGVNLKTLINTNSGVLIVGSFITDETVGGTYRSRDGGETWEAFGLADTVSVEALAVNSSGDFFAATHLGMFRSRDEGETWTMINNGFENLDVIPLVIALAIQPHSDHIFAAIKNSGVWRSTNQGNTWMQTPLEAPSVRTIVINSAGHIFVGSIFSFPTGEYDGVFCSADNGETWTQCNQGLTNINISSLAVDSAGFLYAGTWGDGVFRTKEPTIP